MADTSSAINNLERNPNLEPVMRVIAGESLKCSRKFPTTGQFRASAQRSLHKVTSFNNAGILHRPAKIPCRSQSAHATGHPTFLHILRLNTPTPTNRRPPRARLRAGVGRDSLNLQLVATELMGSSCRNIESQATFVPAWRSTYEFPPPARAGHFAAPADRACRRSSAVSRAVCQGRGQCLERYAPEHLPIVRPAQERAGGA